MRNYENHLPEITLKLTPGTMLKKQIKNSNDCVAIFREVFDDTIELYESMFAVYLNRTNKTIGWIKISQGGLSGTVIDNRIILKAAIESLACGIIICHNHPSGNKTPSNADLNITKKLSEACKILDVNLIDHIILTNDSYLSFADEGLI